MPSPIASTVALRVRRNLRELTRKWLLVRFLKRQMLKIFVLPKSREMTKLKVATKLATTSP